MKFATLPYRKARCRKSRKVDQRRLGPSLGADEQRQKDDRQHHAADQGRRRQPPGVAFVQHGHDGGERGRDQERAPPVEATAVGQIPGLRDDEPAEDGADQAERNVDPERPMPAQRIEDQAAQRRSHAQPDRLRRRLQAEAAASFFRSRGEDDDGDAVGRDQRGADRLQDTEGDQHRKIRREAAEARAQDEQEEAARVEELAADHVGKPAEDRHERRHRQDVGDRDPAHGAERSGEIELEPRQQHLRQAGIDLAHEGADAHRPDDEPAIRSEPCDGLQRRRFAALEHGIAKRGERGRARR